MSCAPPRASCTLAQLALFAAVFLVAGCTANKTWTEEVQLLDGRVIEVTQKRHYDIVATSLGDDLVPRDCWLLAELQTRHKTVWHEALLPIVLNEFQGNWYLIAMPPTIVEYRKYGRPHPGYVAFLLSAGAWKRVPLDAVPSAVYDANLLIAHAPSGNSSHLSLDAKKQANSDPRYPRWTTRVDPSWNSIE